MNGSRNVILHFACILLFFIPVLIIIIAIKLVYTPQCSYGEADITACHNYTLPNAEGIGPFYSSITTLEHPIPIDKIEASSNCGDEARPYFEIFEDDSNRYIITSGIPNHAAECGQIYPNPNIRCEIWQWIKLPLKWIDTGNITKTMGTTGFVMSGAVLFDHRSSERGALAVPAMYSNANNSEACEHIGYMRDGGKLYGLCNKTSCYELKEKIERATNEDDYKFNPSDSCHLDECNMAEKDGEMAYFISSNWPYVPPCLKGQLFDIYHLNVTEYLK